MPKLLIDVKCGKKECGECHKGHLVLCEEFDAVRDLAYRDHFRTEWKRLPACLAAELRAKRLKEKKP